MKLRTLLDLRNNITAFILIMDGKVHEVNILDIMLFEAGSFSIMDRGFIDFSRLYFLHQSQAFYVIKAKKNLGLKRIMSQLVDYNDPKILDR